MQKEWEKGHYAATSTAAADDYDDVIKYEATTVYHSDFEKKRHEENRSEHRDSNGEKRYWRKKENIIYTADIAIVNILDFLPAQQQQKDTHTYIHC